jgi:Mn2+/Fe2+ NRAMP family transporter
LLQAAAQVIRFSLALWVGGTLVLVIAAPLLFRELPSRDLAGRIFGELLRRFEAVKHVLSLLLVLSVFVRLEVTRALEGSAVVMGIGIFLAVATNVYLAMVVRPRLGYMRMKTVSFDTTPADDPWRIRFNRLHRRSSWILMFGWVAAAVALAAQP